MADDAPSIFSLELTTKEQLNRLCQHLWDWKTCENCSHHQPCLLPICSWQRLSRLEPFFQYYKELAASYVSDAFVPHETPALRSHEDLLAIIHLINKRPNQKRADLVKEYFSSRNGSEEVLSADQQIALNIAVKVLLMMDCTVDGHVGGNFEMGGEPSVWHRHQSWEEFISATFPKRDHPSLDEEDKTAPDIKARLKATKLKKTAHLSSEGTNDIRNHLRLDQKTGVVEIFHHTTVLKEHLKASKASHYEGLR